MKKLFKKIMSNKRIVAVFSIIFLQGNFQLKGAIFKGLIIK